MAKEQHVTMNGHRCIIERPAQFAGEEGVIISDDYNGTGGGLLHVRFLRINTSAVFSRAEVRVLPVMA